jgi:hypothetical protein
LNNSKTSSSRNDSLNKDRNQFGNFFLPSSKATNSGSDGFNGRKIYEQPDITRNIYVPHQKADRLILNSQSNFKSVDDDFDDSPVDDRETGVLPDSMQQNEIGVY